LLSKDLAALNYITHFARTGVQTLRIEGQYYEKELVGLLTELYADLIKNPSKRIDSPRLKRLIALSPRGFSLGAYPIGIGEDSSKTHTITRLPSRSDSEDSQLAQSSAY
jgi:collagenase-like PrtC family protease